MVGRRFDPLLWAILAAGTVAAVAIAKSTGGDPYDMESLRLVRAELERAPLHLYETFDARGATRWPYPPAFLPVVWLAGQLQELGVASFDFLVRVPAILADAAIAWVVQEFLGRRGAGRGERLAAAALVCLGPAFLAISGYHGQIDALAILPGVLAVYLWERGAPGRALPAGLLIGVGAAIKTVPGLLVLALLPSARSRREAGLLLAGAAAPVALAFAPFALKGTLPPADVLTYRGLPGVGGLSLLAQPELPFGALGLRSVALSDLSLQLYDHGTWAIGAGLIAVAFVGARSRGGAVPMAVLLWLAVYVLGVNFFFQYALWGLPFFLMAGYVRQVALAELVLLGPTIVFYRRPWEADAIGYAYVAVMLALLATAAVAFAVLARRQLRTAPGGR
ncbi:MAG TPA: glycosyltransferase 87 family protein [Solirubrobacteraceae bacterium]|nr:glycosyltransferase 87 family protein [Solirubrobacteraceae bacterium]